MPTPKYVKSAKAKRAPAARGRSRGRTRPPVIVGTGTKPGAGFGVTVGKTKPVLKTSPSFLTKVGTGSKVQPANRHTTTLPDTAMAKPKKAKPVARRASAVQKSRMK